MLTTVSCTISGISEVNLQVIKDVTGFRVGKLPVSYLGIPLMTKKPTVRGFDPLIHKMRSKVENWSTRHLSYAGRLQLVQVVLDSVKVF